MRPKGEEQCAEAHPGSVVVLGVDQGGLDGLDGLVGVGKDVEQQEDQDVDRDGSQPGPDEHPIWSGTGTPFG